MTSEQPDEELWRPDARERFRSAAADLVDAIRRHSEELLNMTGPEASDVSPAQEERLTDAAAAYAAAQFDYAGTVPPLGLGYDDEDDEYADGWIDEAKDAPTCITVLRRADFRVLDLDAVLQAGRQAYEESWPTKTEEVQQDVNHLGRALYQVEHSRGLDALNDLAGLQRAGATTWILEAQEVLGDVDANSWPDDPFDLEPDVEGRTLHRLDEVDG